MTAVQHVGHDLPRPGRYLRTLTMICAAVLAVTGLVGVLDAVLSSLIGDGGARWTAPAVLVLAVTAAAVSWRQEPDGSSLSGVFGGQIASPRSRAGRGEPRRVVLLAVLTAVLVVVSILGWSSR